MKRKTVGGAALLIAGCFIGRETLVWAFNKVLDAASAGVRNGVSFAGLSWQNGIATALIVIGIALVAWPKATPKNKRVNDGYDLLALSASIINRVRQHRAAKWFQRDRIEPVTDIARAALSALLTFHKARYVTPALQFEYAEQVAVGAETYFSTLYQLMAQGHKAEAIALSASASEQAAEAGRRFNAQQWFLPDY